MLFDCDIEKLGAMFNDFGQATGVYPALVNEDFTYYLPDEDSPENEYCFCMEHCSESACACRASDRKLLERCRKSQRAEMHICHGGLVDIAAPILHEGRILGYIITGQMKQEPDFSVIAPRLAGLPLDLARMERYYEKIRFFDEKQIRGIMNLLVLLARCLVIENIIAPSVDHSISAVLEYIDRNLSEPLDVQRISANTNLSASTLYRMFRKRFQCTVSEYITQKRLIRSEVLLRSTPLSIEEIAHQVGFSGTSYYSRCFRKKNGVSPLQFRKLQKKGTAPGRDALL